MYSLYRVSQESGTLDFHYFDIWNYSIFWYHQINIVFWKEWYQVHLIWFSSIDSTTILWNSNLQILFNLRELFMMGLAVHKFFLCFVRTDQWAPGQQCMEVRKAIIPDWNVTRMKRKLTMKMFLERTIESKLLNQLQWSSLVLYHSSQKTMFYLMK